MLHMIVKQTWEYPMRMAYDLEAKRFVETEYESLPHRRRFTKPYGWIKESGTPPSPPLGLHPDDRPDACPGG